ncbi:MAG: glycosyltransferase [Erysipelotrichaceae bacterium]|nr:glycosyltransferase [Erysipelotrichaceae bacterium]
MKILICTDFYKNNLGGVTTSLLALSCGLKKLGHEVKILTLSADNCSYREKEAYYIASFPANYAPGMRMSFEFDDPLIDQLIQWQPDIIHVQSEATVFLMAKKIAKKCHKPLIMTCHTDYAYFLVKEKKDLFIFKAIAYFLGKLVYGPAKVLVVPSKKACGFSFLQAHKDKMYVIPNGIQLENFTQRLSMKQRQELKKRYGIKNEAKIMTAITRLSKEKNISELIEYLPDLLKEIPEAVLLIVGEGPDRKRLEKRVEQLQLQDHVVFSGYIAADDVWAYYDLADVFVSASVFEVHSMSYLEALALGKPLLCRKDEALDGVLEDHENGFIYQNKQEFVQYAKILFNDEEVRKQMGLNSLEKAKQFSAESFGQNAVALYESVIAETDPQQVLQPNTDRV